MPFSANISSASPTCLLSLTSLVVFSFRRMTCEASRLEFGYFVLLFVKLPLPRASPRDGAGESTPRT
jgi:hypothetical protein